jgi:hypothetical protein
MIFDYIIVGGSPEARRAEVEGMRREASDKTPGPWRWRACVKAFGKKTPGDANFKEDKRRARLADKTARLRELRLAREAEEAAIANGHGPGARVTET